MRYCVLIVCLLAALAAGLAQGQQPLVLSRSLTAIRITNPEEQLRTFAPLLSMIDSLRVAPPTGAGQARPGGQANAAISGVSALLHRMVEHLKTLPGVEADAPLWIVIMPPPFDPDVPAFITDNGGMQPNPALRPPVYLVLPLADPPAFAAYVDAGRAEIPTTICGNFAVCSMEKTPAFDTVVLDLPLVSTREIAIAFSVNNLNLDSMEENAPPIIGPMLSPVIDVIAEQQQNILRVECGLTMLGRDLSLETFITPVPGGQLARSLETLPPSGLAAEYAAYLPKNLAYCGAGGPAVPGMPGTAQVMLRMAFGLLGIFMPQREDMLQQSLANLSAQCSQGRAIGMTAPAGPQDGATLVAAYRITDPTQARGHLRNFIDELVYTRSTVFGGILSNMVTFEITPDAETIEGLPVDLVKIAVTPPALAPPVNLECRIVYQDDKMLAAMGYQSRDELAALIQRVRQPDESGFTASAAYARLQNVVPEQAYAFESISARELCLILAGWLPAGQQRNGVRLFLSMFPPQAPPIATYQGMQAGRMYGEIRIPGQQLDFIYSVLKAVQQLRPAGE